MDEEDERESIASALSMVPQEEGTEYIRTCIYSLIDLHLVQCQEIDWRRQKSIVGCVKIATRVVSLLF